MIPTAEEIISDIDEIARNYDHYEYGLPTSHYDLNLEMQSKIIEFAKLHVEAALKEASEKATAGQTFVDMGGEFEDIPIYEAYVVKDSILNAYPLENIK